MVPVSRAGEEGVGWREVVEVEVFVVGGAGGLCHWEGVGVGVFASMSMVVVVVVQRTKWSVLLSSFYSGFFLSRWAVSRYMYLSPLLTSSSSSFSSSSSSPPSFTLHQGAR